MKPPPDPEWEARVRASFRRQPFMALIGAEIAKLAPGLCTLTLAHKRELTQQRGFLHGGVVGALADSAMGYAAYSLMPANSSPLTVEYKINLLSPAIGQRFRAEGRIVRAGRTLTIAESDVFAETADGDVAIARVTSTLICMQGVSDDVDEARLSQAVTGSAT